MCQRIYCNGRIEFDPRKNRADLEKHGIDLPTASQIWNDLVFEREDDRRDYGETRIVALGAIEGRVLVVVYTWRGSAPTDLREKGKCR